jgi:hypothetical protein
MNWKRFGMKWPWTNWGERLRKTILIRFHGLVNGQYFIQVGRIDRLARHCVLKLLLSENCREQLTCRGHWPHYTQISPGPTERPWDEVCKPPFTPGPRATVFRGGMAARLVDGLADTMAAVSPHQADWPASWLGIRQQIYLADQLNKVPIFDKTIDSCSADVEIHLCPGKEICHRHRRHLDTVIPLVRPSDTLSAAL